MPGRATTSDAANRRRPVAKLAKSDALEQPPVLQRLVAEIPWGHNLLILNKIADPAARLYYLRATARFGWTRNALLNQIKAGAYERAAAQKKTHNFELALLEQEPKMRVDTHEAAIVDVLQRIMKIIDPPPPSEPPLPEIGFHVKEDAAPYRIGRKRRGVRC